MHHLGYYVDDIQDAISSMSAAGFDVVQTGAGFGVDGDGAFAYYNAVDVFGCYLEAIEGPQALPPAEAVVPAAPQASSS